MSLGEDQELAKEIEAVAARLARGAGEILLTRFGGSLEVEYKDEKKRDPVTSADKESQSYLTDAISGRFGDHGILGEEDPGEEEAPCPDYLWVLDPLDGTTNFMNGLPVYGVSIGVLYRGAPLAGALFIPWPRSDGGFVLHARKGGGAWIDGEPVSIPEAGVPEATRLTGIPGSLGARYRLGKELRRRMGEVRVTGSIAYELALMVRGSFQYVVFGAPKIWDVAAGASIVAEAGGAVLVRYRGSRRWKPLTSFYPEVRGRSSQRNGSSGTVPGNTAEDPQLEAQVPSVKALRGWTGSLIAGGSQVAPFVAGNLQRRSPLRARIAELLRRKRHHAR